MVEIFHNYLLCTYICILIIECYMEVMSLEKRLDVNAIIVSAVTSDLIRMCVFGSALYHCHNCRERFVALYRMHRPCLETRSDYMMCAQFLLWTLLFSFQDKPVSICYQVRGY